MLFELAKMQSADGELTFAGDLPGLLYATVDSLEYLADGLQEFSRFERGRVLPNLQPGDLVAVTREAADAAPSEAEFEAPGALPAHFDAPLLTRAISQLITAADYSGAGTGEVRIEARPLAGRACLTIKSGLPGGDPAPAAADMGFGFFAARRAIVAMGGEITFERCEGFLAINVSFPLGTV